MKKLARAILVLSVLFLVACSTNAPQSKEPFQEERMETLEADQEQAPSASPQDSIAYDEPSAEQSIKSEGATTSFSTDILDYFPFQQNIVKSYENELGEEVTSYTQFITEDRVQFAVKKGNVENIDVYEKEEDEIRVVFSKQGINYRESFIDQTGFVGVYLRGPVEIGTSWVDVDKQEATITNVNVMIDGISSIEVTTENSISYYGYQVGLIKRILNPDFNPTNETLKMIKFDQSTGISLMIYTNENGNWKQRPINYVVRTNDEYKDFLKNELVKSLVIPESMEIHSMHKKSSDNRVYVDVSAHIYDGITSYQEEVNRLQSILRSIGFAYSVNEIYLWVDGAAYQGPFVQLAKNELLKVTQ